MQLRVSGALVGDDMCPLYANHGADRHAHHPSKLTCPYMLGHSDCTRYCSCCPATLLANVATKLNWLVVNMGRGGPVVARLVGCVWPDCWCTLWMGGEGCVEWPLWCVLCPCALCVARVCIHDGHL